LALTVNIMALLSSR